jgi:hypothetical protein
MNFGIWHLAFGVWCCVEDNVLADNGERKECDNFLAML